MSLNRREAMEKRRRLLKAAAGTPAIFTLLCGSSVAAASTTCADKAAAGEGPDPTSLTPVDADGVPVESDPDHYVDEEGNAYYDVGEGQLVADSCWASLGMGPTASIMGRIV